MAQSSGAGYEVSTSGLHGVSRQLKQCHEDVCEVTREFQARSGQAGLGGVKDAWDAFSREWADQAGHAQWTINQLADQMSATAATYQHAEEQAQGAVSGVAP